MFRRVPPHPPSGRGISHAAIVCFAVSAIAFVACGMGLFVNHMLTGSLAISGTAAVGLIYLAMGLMNLGYEMETETPEVTIASSEGNLQDGRNPPQTDDAQNNVAGDDSDVVGAIPCPSEHANRVSTTRDVAYSSRE